MLTAGCFRLCVLLILRPVSYFIIEFFHEYISMGLRQASGVCDVSRKTNWLKNGWVSGDESSPDGSVSRQDYF
jgi:hypothetical protein